MTTKQTKGKWNWHKHQGPFVSSNFYSLMNEDGEIIIDDGSASGTQTSIIDANSMDAHLISAAPDLLDSVRDLLCVIAGVSSDSKEDLKRAKKAIHKATGN